MVSPNKTHTDLTPEQITASRDRLLSEGFHPNSTAVRIHDQLLSVTRALELATELNYRNVDGACQSIGDLQAECERLRVSLDAARSHAIDQDCGRLCDRNATLKYHEQWKHSEAYVDGLIRSALARAECEVA